MAYPTTYDREINSDILQFVARSICVSSCEAQLDHFDQLASKLTKHHHDEEVFKNIKKFNVLNPLSVV